MRTSTHINPENGSACPCFGKGYISDYLISPVMPQDRADRIIGEMDQGVMIGNNGHGSMQHPAHGNIVFTDDIPHLSNGQRLPVMVILTCLNGCFAKPNGSRSLAEETLLSDGAVAAFASTRLTRAQVQKLLDQGLVGGHLPKDGYPVGLSNKPCQKGPPLPTSRRRRKAPTPRSLSDNKMRDKNSIVKSDPISFYDMQKVQDRVKKMLGTSHAVTLIGLSFFSFVYFTLLQGPWIFSETKRLAIGNDFAFQKRKSMPNFNTLWSFHGMARNLLHTCSKAKAIIG